MQPPLPTYKSVEREECPAYYNLSTKPVRQHPITTYSEDPDEAGIYWMSVTCWRLEQKLRESRRRIVAALRTSSVCSNCADGCHRCYFGSHEEVTMAP